jgi:hypothetical protein
MAAFALVRFGTLVAEGSLENRQGAIRASPVQGDTDEHQFFQ